MDLVVVPWRREKRGRHRERRFDGTWSLCTCCIRDSKEGGSFVVEFSQNEKYISRAHPRNAKAQALVPYSSGWRAR